jgi:hypothetical protein
LLAAAIRELSGCDRIGLGYGKGMPEGILQYSSGNLEYPLSRSERYWFTASAPFSRHVSFALPQVGRIDPDPEAIAFSSQPGFVDYRLMEAPHKEVVCGVA